MLLEQRAEGLSGAGTSAALLPQRLLHDLPAFFEFDIDGKAGATLLVELVQPRGEQVAPGDDGVEMTAVGGQLHVATPTVVLRDSHRQLLPMRFVLTAKQKRGRNAVVAVAEDVGLHP